MRDAFCDAHPLAHCLRYQIGRAVTIAENTYSPGSQDGRQYAGWNRDPAWRCPCRDASGLNGDDADQVCAAGSLVMTGRGDDGVARYQITEFLRALDSKLDLCVVCAFTLK